MNSTASRRALLTGGLAVVTAAVLATQEPERDGDARFGDVNIQSFSRDPLQVAMLDRHAVRLAPLIPDLEVLIGRRVAIEALTFDQLYANFTFDLMQQTGKYDVVSMCDAWIPYFGHAGYFSEVPMPAEAGGERQYPVKIEEAAQGIDGTPLVAHPWTFDFVCSAFGSGIETGATATWMQFARLLSDDLNLRISVPALAPMTSSETFRAMALSFGQDVIDASTSEPGLSRYGSERAMQQLIQLSERTGVENALATTWEQVAEAARNGSINHAPLILATDLRPLLDSGQWITQLLPVGRENRARTSGQIWMVAVPAGAPSLDEARTAIQWLTSTSIQRRLWAECALLPATRPAINDTSAPTSEQIRILMLRALDAMQPIPRLRSFQPVMEIAGETVPLALRDPDNANFYLAAADEAAQAEIDR